MGGHEARKGIGGQLARQPDGGKRVHCGNGDVSFIRHHVTPLIFRYGS
jgi:hypothetical protein